MTERNVLLTLHILTAIVTFGWLATQAMLAPRLLRQGPGSLEAVRFSHSRGELMGRLSPIVFLLGIALIVRSDGAYEFSQSWLSASMGLFIVATVIGAVLIGGAEKRALARLEAGEDASDDAKRIAMFGGINMLILLVIVYLMVAKPGLV